MMEVMQLEEPPLLGRQVTCRRRLELCRRIRSGRAAWARGAASVLVAIGVCEDVGKPTVLSVWSRVHAPLCHAWTAVTHYQV